MVDIQEPKEIVCRRNGKSINCELFLPLQTKVMKEWVWPIAKRKVKLFSKRFGPPTFVTPEKAVWEDAVDPEEGLFFPHFQVRDQLDPFKRKNNNVYITMFQPKVPKELIKAVDRIDSVIDVSENRVVIVSDDVKGFMEVIEDIKNVINNPPQVLFPIQTAKGVEFSI